MKKRMIGMASLLAAGALLSGCGKGADVGTNATAGAGSLGGAVSADGSSTVGPIMSAVAEEFSKEYPDVRFTVGISGTGGGFKKFVAGETDLQNASRPIEEKEIAEAKKNGVEFIELPIAFDGLSVVVNPANDFVSSLTVAELKKIWEPGSQVKTWDQVRPEFPKEEIKLYGAGTDSGTFDYFTKAINGKEKASRSDYQASEDDNTLVQGVSGDKFSLGYFGYAYYEQNSDKLRLLSIDGGAGPVAPSPETIANGTYQPLSRPLLVYVNKKSLAEKPAVRAAVLFLLSHATELIPSVGYVPLPAEDYAAVRSRFDSGTTGTAFKGAEVGLKIKDLLGREATK